MLKVGKSYLFLTVLYHYIGVFHRDFGDFYQLEDSDWIVSMGYLKNALKTGKVEEFEHIGNLFVRKDSLIGIAEWDFAHPSDNLSR